MTRTLTIAALLGVATLALAPAAARAQRARGVHKIQGVRPDVHLDLGFYGAVGAGFRIDIPIVPDGVLGNGKDEMAISPGADLVFAYWNDRYAGVQEVVFFPHVVWQWNFYLSPSWSIFPEAGLGLWFGDYGHHHHRHDRYQEHTHVFFDPVVGFGARFHASERIALLMRAIWPLGLQIGVTF